MGKVGGGVKQSQGGWVWFWTVWEESQRKKSKLRDRGRVGNCFANGGTWVKSPWAKPKPKGLLSARIFYGNEESKNAGGGIFQRRCENCLLGSIGRGKAARGV